MFYNCGDLNCCFLQLEGEWPCSSGRHLFVFQCPKGSPRYVHTYLHCQFLCVVPFSIYTHILGVMLQMRDVTLL